MNENLKVVFGRRILKLLKRYNKLLLKNRLLMTKNILLSLLCVVNIMTWFSFRSVYMAGTMLKLIILLVFFSLVLYDPLVTRMILDF